MKKSSIALLMAVSLSANAVPAYIRTQDRADICSTKTSTVRNVPPATKRYVYKRDGVPMGNHTGKCSGLEGCEIDHRVSLWLGGSNDPSNLMVQPYDGPCNAHDKDKLEVTLHRLACRGKISVEEAQTLIYNNWQAGYSKFIDSRGCGL